MPAGWFPRDAQSVSAFLEEFQPNRGLSRAAISPHAGWYYSGRLAALGISSLKRDADTIIVLGGHLQAASPSLFAMEDAVRTPFGSLQIDSELRSALLDEFDGDEDRYRDNTIEVLLPMVHYFFRDSRLLWLRLPAEIESFESGRIISKAAAKLKRKINVIASTDLTHYGANYGFSPHGRGKEALKWVKEVNDAGFIKAVEEGNSKEVLRCAQKEQAACSAGAVLGVLGFAKEENLSCARLLEYATSADVSSDVFSGDSDSVPDSFVGYAAFSFT